MQPSNEALTEHVAGVDLLVVGDAVLDVWLTGSSGRLCREAPVPVVDVSEREAVPGGAANAAVNAAAMGARVRFLGVVGADTEGEQLRSGLRRWGVDDGYVVTDPTRRTPTKARLLCDGQVVARFDRDAGAVSRAVLDRVAAALPELAAAADAVLVCDYGDTALADTVREVLCAIRHRVHAPLVVDAHDLSPWAAARPAAVTPSAGEALALIGRPARADRIAALAGASADLLAASGADLAVTTLDRDGALLHRADHPPHRTHAVPAAPSRTCGAGDTFSAAFAIALGAGWAPVRAVELAQRAANVVVGRTGTSVCSAADLAVGDQPPAGTGAQPAALSAAQVTARVAEHRARGRRIVFTNGCFDLMHTGHAAYLEQARRCGDVLVVAVNSDASVRRLKGADRPIMPAGERAALLAALACVDIVTIFDEDSPRRLLELVRPDVYVKGGDYTADMLPETPLVRDLGGEVHIVDYVARHSTTQLIASIRGGAGAVR